MDGCVVCCDGEDDIVHSARDDSQYSDARFVVYFGGWIGIHDWGYILFVAENEILARGMASIRNWG